jgi:hypothetical protein
LDYWGGAASLHQRTFGLGLRRTPAKEAPRLGQRQDRCDAGDLLSCVTAGATTAALVASRPGRSWGPSGGDDAGADPTMAPAAVSLAPTSPWASCGARRCGHRSLGPLPRSWGPGHRLPLVALMPQWRQNYPNNRPPTRATAISAMGHNRPPIPLSEAREIDVTFNHELPTGRADLL